MTKKLMLLIVLIVSVISVVFIAVWGTLPEGSNLAQVDTIAFTEYDELNTDDEKIINLQDIVTEEEHYYTLYYSFSPEDAYASISASSSSSDVTVLVDEITKEVLVDFSTAESVGRSVTIRITDQKTHRYDEITLIFKITGTVSGD